MKVLKVLEGGVECRLTDEEVELLKTAIVNRKVRQEREEERRRRRDDQDAEKRMRNLHKIGTSTTTRQRGTWDDNLELDDTDRYDWSNPPF